MKYILLLVMLSGCTPLIDKDAGKYYDEFVSEMDKRSIPRKKVTIEIRKEEILINRGESYVTVTAKCDDDNKEIIINYYAWEKMNDCEREFLIFHELGHCELDLINESEENGIMYENSLSDCNKFLVNKKEWVEGIFNASNKIQ